MTIITPYIPYRLDGKVALVTGSGRGIGAAMATELGRCGAKVVVNYANAKDSAEKVVAEIKNFGTDAVAFKADVRQVSQIIKLMDDAVAHFGSLDIVCSNSGVVSFGHMGEVTEVCTPLDSIPNFESRDWRLKMNAFHRKSLIASLASTHVPSSLWHERHTVT